MVYFCSLWPPIILLFVLNSFTLPVRVGAAYMDERHCQTNFIPVSYIFPFIWYGYAWIYLWFELWHMLPCQRYCRGRGHHPLFFPCLLTSSNVTSSLRWGDLEQPSVKHMERELAPRSLSRDSPLERAGLPSPAWSICGLQVRSEWSGTLTDVFARLLQWCGCCIGLLW